MISELIINAFLVTIMLAIAIALIKTRTLIFTVILTSAYSLVAALMFITLDAVDVAFTEASVGAGISTILFLAAMAYLPKKEEENIGNQFVPALTCIILCAILIWCSYDLPQIGLVSSPIHQHIAPDYILGSRNDIGIPNIVTSVLASYRGYDTFGETIVVFTAGVAVLVLLQNSNPPPKKLSLKLRRRLVKMHKNPILRVSTKILFAPIILFGLYVQFHGDFGPGGGFQAGVIVASAFILYSIVFGLEKGKELFPLNVNLFLLALGGIIYGGVGVTSILLGEEFLSYNPLGSTPQSGQHIGILLVEFGVGLTVSNVMIALFNAFVGFKSGKGN